MTKPKVLQFYGYINTRKVEIKYPPQSDLVIQLLLANANWLNNVAN